MRRYFKSINKENITHDKYLTIGKKNIWELLLMMLELCMSGGNMFHIWLPTV